MNAQILHLFYISLSIVFPSMSNKNKRASQRSHGRQTFLENKFKENVYLNGVGI